MKFDTPMALMLGVAGLGAFAVYKLTQTKASSPQTTSAVDVASQQLPALKLVQNTHYQGRLTLQQLDVPPLASTRDQLAEFLQLLGLKNVAVYMSPGELPATWTELRTGDDSSRWFEGDWTGPDITLPRPRQIDRLSGNGQTLISGMTG